MPFHRLRTACLAATLLACASAQAADRRVTFELVNTADAPVLGVTVERSSVFSSSTFDKQEIKLERPLAPGQSRKFTVDIGEHHDTMPYVVRWRWTRYGGCQGSAKFPGYGDAFTTNTGAATCPGDKPLPERRTEGREALLAEAKRADIKLAKDLYAALLARNPDDEGVLHERAHALIAENRSEFGDAYSAEAVADLQRALQLSNTQKEGLHYRNDLVRHYLAHKRWKEALPHLDELVAAYPQLHEVVIYRAAVHCELGNLAKAAEDEHRLGELLGTPIPEAASCAQRKASRKG